MLNPVQRIGDVIAEFLRVEADHRILVDVFLVRFEAVHGEFVKKVVAVVGVAIVGGDQGGSHRLSETPRSRQANVSRVLRHPGVQVLQQSALVDVDFGCEIVAENRFRWVQISAHGCLRVRGVPAASGTSAHDSTRNGVWLGNAALFRSQ